MSQQADSFRRSTIRPVRERALLGSPPEEFTNNPNESSNSVVKHWTSFKKSSWPAFICKLQELVNAQLSEADKALYGAGEYSLVPELSHFAVDAVAWHRMSSAQRKAHLCKMASSNLVPNSCQKSVPGLTLSVSVGEVQITSISESTLQNIWEKAERLLSTPNAIAPAPGNSNARMVASESSSRPHFVQKGAGGRFVCDDNCLMWRGRKLCSHTVAVAECVKGLPQFISTLQKSKPECNLTNLMTTPSERQKAGTKSGAPKKFGSSVKKVPVTTYRSRLESVCYPASEPSEPLSTSSPPEHNTSGEAGTFRNFLDNPHSPPPLPPWYGYGSDPYLYPQRASMYSPYGYPYSSPSMHYQPNASVATPNASAATPNASAATKPFSVELLNKRIKKCRGCSREFLKKLDGSPPDAPLNMVISHEERRPFFDSQNVQRTSRPQNVYYHCNLACIRASHPSFVGHQLQIPADVELCPVNKKYLQEHFQV